MGVRFPLPAPRIQFSFTVLRGGDAELLGASGTKLGTVRILRIFNRLRISGT
jgi:hypothetical protein